MSKIAARLAAALAIAPVAAVILTASPAGASTQPAVQSGMHPASAAACDVYRVTEDAYVRENPSNNSVVRKTKTAGEQVTNCWGAHATEPGGDDWTAVACDCATDGQGWIISRKLQWIGVS